MITIYAPDQHDLYDGLFTISAGRIYMVGGVNDPPGWDHMDNAVATVKPVDFCIRSPQQNPANRPNRDVFMHFFGMEVTWK